MINDAGILSKFLNNYFVIHKRCYDELFENENFQKILFEMDKCWRSGNTIYLAGNGGSAAMVSHFATDWTKGLHFKTGKMFRTRDLTSNIPLLTASANDLSWEDALAAILEMTIIPGDILFMVSSSGNSKNLLILTDKAKSLGIKTISLSGFGKSKLASMTDLALTTSSEDVQQIEDSHSLFGHLVYKLFCEEI